MLFLKAVMLFSMGNTKIFASLVSKHKADMDLSLDGYQPWYNTKHQYSNATDINRSSQDYTHTS